MSDSALHSSFLLLFFLRALGWTDASFITDKLTYSVTVHEVSLCIGVAFCFFDQPTNE